MTVEISLTRPHPPRPYDTRSHIHTGPLVIATKPTLWQSLGESTERLMYLRVYDNRDNSRKITPFPSLWYSLTHSHMSIGYRHQTQSLSESVSRLMYLRVYDSRDNSRKTVPSLSLWYSLTHTHRSIGYRNQTHPLPKSSVRLMYLRVCDSRDRSHKITPSLSLWYLQVTCDFFGGIDA